MDRSTTLVYSKNGTVQILSADPLPPVVSGFTIAICFLFGVAYNFIVTTSIVSSRKLRSCPFHALLAATSVTCLLDCLLNEALAFGFLFDGHSSWCMFSGGVFLVLLLAQSTALMFLCLERSLTIHEHQWSVLIWMAVFASTWTLCFLLLIPLFSSSDIHYFPNRNACSGVALSLLLPVLVLLAFLLTWTITAISCILFIKKYIKDQNQLSMLSVFPVTTRTQTSLILPSDNWSKNRIVSTILLLHTILVLPLSLSVVVNLFLDPYFELDPWIDPRADGDLIRAVSTNNLEPLFVYCRYMYNVVTPIVVLSTDRQVRIQGRQIFCCRMSEVSALDCRNSRESDLRPGTVQMSETHCSLKTPVLFATREGLHLRAPARSGLGGHEAEASTSESIPRLVTTFCDLTSSMKVSADDTLTSEKVPVEEIDNSRPEQKNVLFSSEIDAIPPVESGVWSQPEASSQSETRVINEPLIVKGEELQQ